MKRLITGLVVFACWLLLIIYGDFQVFWLVLSGIGAIALYEYVAMAFVGASSVTKIAVFLCGFLPYLAAYSGSNEAVAASLPIALILALGFIVFYYQNISEPFMVLSRAGLAILYVGFCGAHLVLLRNDAIGMAWLLWLTGITVGSDSFAYYVGKSLGKRKLCPAVSPGKTVAGFVGGLAGSVIVSLLLARYLFVDHSPVVMGVAAAGLSCVGVLGDLCESVIKRAMSVKDSGNLLPGHGGMLDRIDSLLFTAPVLFTLVQYGYLVP